MTARTAAGRAFLSSGGAAGSAERQTHRASLPPTLQLNSSS